MSFKFTIIIPIYNEKDNLKRLEEELLAFIQTSTITTKVLLINDGSTDESQISIESICNRNKNFSFLLFDTNYGLSTALKAGFDYTDTEFVGYIDADLQTSPKDFNSLLEHISTYDLVTGVRKNRNDGFIKKISSKIANSIRRAFTNDGMDDTGCPLKVIKTEYAKRIPMFRGLHRFLPAMILLQGGTVKQIPIQHFPRLAGTSKFGITNRLLGPLIDCFAYLWMKKKRIHYKVSKQQL
ncbi:glycosyltransferase [Psychroserpens ponticola]|uniref:Glycosyltransferase n=1 Tax=Psychroserpens ponticola TaxID=2932268 RepID=A0ABY7S0G0_9FLAO|nr:glycosyltransferase [Psychroserpens ponticola]WCO02492.1 glycosyltransferase [Psychroserpens ponticola]